MHEFFMDLAIQEAKKGKNRTYKNPLVGAILVKNGKIIGRGAHLEYGHEHAERNAINQCQSSEEVFDSTLYVTLEPCSHYGKQPPCIELIKKSRIKQVVIGQLDPNPLVAGKGKNYLEKQGIKVITGIREREARNLNPYYNFFFENKRPYIVLKQAVTLDGRVTADPLVRTNITGPEVWEKVHEERSQFQSILVGSQTVLTDDPELLSTVSLKFPPVRVIVDRRGRLFNHLGLRIFTDSNAPVWIITEQTEYPQLPTHVKVFNLSACSIKDVVQIIAENNIQSIYVEGGPTIHDAFLMSDCWDESVTYLAPKIMGGDGMSSFYSDRRASHLVSLEQVKIVEVGEDFRISGRRKKCLLD